jgi:hypothetical protein
MYLYKPNGSPNYFDCLQDEEDDCPQKVIFSSTDA